MKNLALIFTAVVLSACGGTNDDGSSKSTYSSCKITKSEALFAEDRDQDLKQCWNAAGKGYESQGDALQWCERQVNSYIASRYVVGHTVQYMVESTNCKS
ncbi:hypothetical protein J1N51_13685 [Psychrosphaera ytuae]|uniref:Lipoprotein n=1 Tax=Psychrosphaera ytuae TaxID=2820710 RepID=A0A975HI26_9GAMM|nr:hypothetical protein [Psychrosphaera ytuae]QTH63747.1 hypothetical protein J1N51_13685 [Psychrosphaera ytuae]